MYSFRELTDIIENEIKHLKYPKEPHLLYEPIAYSLEEGGKRIRPVSSWIAPICGAVSLPYIPVGTTMSPSFRAMQ